MPSKKIEKRLRKTAKKVEEGVKDGLDRLKPGSGKKGKGKIVAAAAGIAAAGVGVAAALKARDRGWKRYLVVPADVEGWDLVVEGADDPLATFARKRDAVAEARSLAHENTPSVLVIQGADGRVLRSHSYPADER